MFEALLKKVEQGQEMIERFGTRRKLDQQVDIAVWTGLTSQNRPEQREPLNAKGPDLPLRRH